MQYVQAKNSSALWCRVTGPSGSDYWTVSMLELDQIIADSGPESTAVRVQTKSD